MTAPIQVRVCPEAERDHRRRSRSFAHVGCRGPNVICIASALRYELPDNFVFAILLHELGHLRLLDRPSHSERAADREGGKIGRVTIKRRSWGTAGNLEYVEPEDVARAKLAVSRLTTYRTLRGVPPWIVAR